jgi:transcription elongation factor Elf1
MAWALSILSRASASYHSREAVEEVITFCCPSCLEHSAVSVSLTRGRQRFVEDCQNCCEPIEFDVETENGEVARFDYRLAN